VGGISPAFDYLNPLGILKFFRKRILSLLQEQFLRGFSISPVPNKGDAISDFPGEAAAKSMVVKVCRPGR
jgi:hypothetical protein